MSLSTGEFVYFDNSGLRIGPEHVMASGALPAGFPGRASRWEALLGWGHLFQHPTGRRARGSAARRYLVLHGRSVEPGGPEPRSIPEVLTRHKDIIYARRSREHMESCCRTHNLGRAVRALYERLPEDLKSDPELQALADLGCHTTVNIVHLVYSGRDGELASKDADFSEAAIEERWAQGYRDAVRAVERAAWLDPLSPACGAVMHELSPE